MTVCQHTAVRQAAHVSTKLCSALCVLELCGRACEETDCKQTSDGQLARLHTFCLWAHSSLSAEWAVGVFER